MLLLLLRLLMEISDGLIFLLLLMLLNPGRLLRFAPLYLNPPNQSLLLFTTASKSAHYLSSLPAPPPP